MIITQSLTTVITASCIALTLLVGPASAQTASNSAPESLTAVAVNMSNVGRTTTSTVDIDIKRWTSDEERDRLMAIFTEQGPQKLLSALADTPRVGTIRTPDSVAYDLHFARNLPGENARLSIHVDRDPSRQGRPRHRQALNRHQAHAARPRVDDRGLRQPASHAHRRTQKGVGEAVSHCVFTVTISR
jgi:hypothetical protein